MAMWWRRSPRRLLIGAVAVLALSGCDSREDRAEKHYTRGQELMARDEVARAQLEFRNALRLNQDHVGARLATARLAEREGNLRAAMGGYARVAEIDAANLPARLKLAQFNLAGGSIEDARRFAEQAVALAPRDPEALAVQAAVQYRLGDETGGLATAARAVEIDPDIVNANVLIIADAVRNGREAEAMARLDGLLARKPDDESLNAVKLRLLTQKGDRAGVEAHLKALVARLPDNTQHRRNLAAFHIAEQRLDQAETEVRELVARAPEDSDAALTLVRLVGANRGEAAARAELEALITARRDPPQRQPLQFALADLLYQAGQRAEARALLEAAMKEPTRNVMIDRVRMRLARLELGEGNRARARVLIDQVLDRDGDNVEALELRARIEIDEERPEEAILTLRRALGLAPQNATLMLLEARAHERNGNPTLVGERLSGALRASNFSPEVALTYARFLRGRDQGASAETVLEESARRHPQNRDVLAALAELRLVLGDAAGAEAAGRQLRQLEDGGAIADRIAAATLLRQGRTEEGMTLLERLVEEQAQAEAQSQGALASLVATYVRNGENGRAIALLDELIAENPANVRAQVLRAELDVLVGDAAAAERRLTAAVAAAPQVALGHIVLARFYAQRNRAVEAEEVTRRGREAVPGDQALALFHASLLEQRGGFDDALAVYADLYRRYPDSMVVANNYASLLAEFGEHDAETVARAARIARRLRTSEVPHFQDTYAWTAFLSGNVEEARRVLKETAPRLPNNPLVRYHYGRVLAATGAAEEARREFEAALAIDPNFPKADAARAALRALEPRGG
jgi:predicted Zn-dependent protease